MLRVPGAGALHEEHALRSLPVGRSPERAGGEHPIELLGGDDVVQPASEVLEFLEIVGMRPGGLDDRADPEALGAVGSLQLDVELPRLPLDTDDVRRREHADPGVRANLLHQRSIQPKRLRCRKHMLQGWAAIRGGTAAQRDPDDATYFRVVYEADYVISGDSVSVVKVSQAGEVAQPTEKEDGQDGSNP